jgi:hypothetical protein
VTLCKHQWLVTAYVGSNTIFFKHKIVFFTYL